MVQQGPPQQMRGPQQQMKGPQQQMRGPQQQMNGVADPDQNRMTRLQAEADKEVEEHKRRLAEQKRKANEPPPPPKTITVMAGNIPSVVKSFQAHATLLLTPVLL